MTYGELWIRLGKALKRQPHLCSQEAETADNWQEGGRCSVVSSFRHSVVMIHEAGEPCYCEETELDEGEPLPEWVAQHFAGRSRVVTPASVKKVAVFRHLGFIEAC